MSETLCMISKLQYKIYHSIEDDYKALLKRIHQRIIIHKLLLKNQIHSTMVINMIFSFCAIAKFKINSLKECHYAIVKNGN